MDRIWEWSGAWQMEFNLGKCKIMEFGKSDRRSKYDYKMGSEIICRGVEEKDLGVSLREFVTGQTHQQDNGTNA